MEQKTERRRRNLSRDAKKGEGKLKPSWWEYPGPSEFPRAERARRRKKVKAQRLARRKNRK